MSRSRLGLPDLEYSRKTNSEILRFRLKQVGGEVEEAVFFQKFDQLAVEVVSGMKLEPYEGIPELLQELTPTCLLCAVSTGTARLQRAVLEKLGLLDYINWELSFFHGEFTQKKQALEMILAQTPTTKTLTMIGDAPGDMKAVRTVNHPKVKLLAIGSRVQGLITDDQLTRAGANLVVASYEAAEREKIVQLIKG